MGVAVGGAKELVGVDCEVFVFAIGVCSSLVMTALEPLGCGCSVTPDIIYPIQVVNK